MPSILCGNVELVFWRIFVLSSFVQKSSDHPTFTWLNILKLLRNSPICCQRRSTCDIITSPEAVTIQPSVGEVIITLEFFPFMCLLDSICKLSDGSSQLTADPKSVKETCKSFHIFWEPFGFQHSCFWLKVAFLSS